MMGRRAPEMPKIAPNTIRWINYDRALEQRSLFFFLFSSLVVCVSVCFGFSLTHRVSAVALVMMMAAFSRHLSSHPQEMECSDGDGRARASTIAAR